MNVWHIAMAVVSGFMLAVTISSLVRRIKEARWTRKAKKELAGLKEQLMKAIEEMENDNT